MRWAISWEAVVVGLVIAVLWIGLEGRIPSVGAIWDMAAEFIAGKERPEPKEVVPWNPLAFYQDNLALAWFFIAVRVLGRSLVVPAMEEVFYRSFVYRYIGNPQFMDVPIGVWHSVAFVVTAFFFGLAHPGQWLAAILCAMAYQALVIRKKRLGDAMTAHAITNLVISVYAIGTGQWHFT
jgi:CAAX prenyl protease-like protein